MPTSEKLPCGVRPPGLPRARQAFLCSAEQTRVVQGPDCISHRKAARGLCPSRARAGRPWPVPDQPAPTNAGPPSVLSFRGTPVRTSSEPSTVLAIEGSLNYNYDSLFLLLSNLQKGIFKLLS